VSTYHPSKHKDNHIFRTCLKSAKAALIYIKRDPACFLDNAAISVNRQCRTGLSS